MRQQIKTSHQGTMARHDKYMSLTWHAHYIYNDYATRDVEADIFEADQIAHIIYIVYKQM